MLTWFQIISAALSSTLSSQFPSQLKCVFLLQAFFPLNFHPTPFLSAYLVPFLYGMNVVTSSFSLSDSCNREIVLSPRDVWLITLRWMLEE
jgi:hypothetical protein